MAKVFWDTNLFVYLFEDRGDRAERVVEIRRSMIQRGDELVTSALTVAELMAQPMREGRRDLVRKYETLFGSYNVTVVAFGLNEAKHYAGLRAQYALHPADCIQVACAAAAKCSLFVTNDRRLAKLKWESIEFFASLQTCPL